MWKMTCKQTVLWAVTSVVLILLVTTVAGVTTFVCQKTSYDALYSTHVCAVFFKFY